MLERDANRDLDVVDRFLTSWDCFACGANDLMPSIKSMWPEFEAALTRLLEARDPRATSRMVFYPVVMVGGFIPVDSDLGRAVKSIVKDEVSPIVDKQGKQSYFAGDLFHWWEAHQSELEPFPLFEEWRGRDFAQSKVIPGYRRMLSNRPGKASGDAT